MRKSCGVYGRCGETLVCKMSGNGKGREGRVVEEVDDSRKGEQRKENKRMWRREVKIFESNTQHHSFFPSFFFFLFFWCVYN
jgi:hypothetical protein